MDRTRADFLDSILPMTEAKPLTLDKHIVTPCDKAYEAMEPDTDYEAFEAGWNAAIQHLAVKLAETCNAAMAQ